jgi:parvulin-like peptidyl-prolyl isomerase
LAQAALAKAATDFEGALEGADPGSDGDVGWLGRGVLELAVEHAVFSLDKGQVHAAPLDTPRGFWIVRRVK